MRKLLSEKSGDFSIRNQFLSTLMVAFLFVVYVTSGSNVITATGQKDLAPAVTKTETDYTLSFDIQENSNPRTSSFTVKTADNKMVTVHTTEKTVKSALIQAKVKLSKDNIVTPALNTKLKDNATIVITKKPTPKKVVQPKKEETPKAEEAVTASTKSVEPVAATKEEPVVPKETPKKETPKKPTTNKQPAKNTAEEKPTIVGNGSVVSPLNYSKNGEQATNELPKNATLYKKGATATAYTAPSGALTASGRAVQVGYVAVDPDKISYGTKLYICSSDGSYIYGYALAADTGSALWNGDADVDLFLNSKSACYNFGRRSDISIYIVD